MTRLRTHVDNLSNGAADVASNSRRKGGEGVTDLTRIIVGVLRRVFDDPPSGRETSANGRLMRKQ